MEQQNQGLLASAEPENETHIGDLLGILLERKWQVFLALAVCLTVGWAYAKYATRIYSGDTFLQVEAVKASSPIEEFSMMTLRNRSQGSTEALVVVSRTLVGRVVDKLGLQIQAAPILSRWDTTPVAAQPALELGRFDVTEDMLGQTIVVERFSDVGYSVSYGALDLGEGVVGEPWSAEEYGLGLYVTGFKRAPIGTRFRVRKVAREQAVASVRGKLQAMEEGLRTGIIRVSMRDTDYRRIRAVLDTLGNEYVAQNVERKSEEAARSLAFLDKQLPSVRAQLDAAEVALNDYLSQNKLVDLSAESQNVLAQLVEIEQQQSSLNLKKTELEQEFNSQHPSLVALAAQERQLLDEKSSIEKQISALPDTQQKALTLTRDVEVNAALYTFLLNKAQELRVIKAGTIGNVRVLDKALAKKRPVEPKSSQILMASAFLGLLLGVLWAFLGHALNRGVRSPEEIEKKLGLSVYATIPFSQAERQQQRKSKKDKASQKLLAATEPGDTALESLRGLRTSLHFALMQADNNRVMIAGPSPGIGKSFISANLSYLLADIDMSVVLVDADMRKGHCHEYFSAERENGLSEYVAGVVDDVGSILKPHPDNDRLSLISTGKIPPNPSELLLSPRFLQLLDTLSERYDLVIIDTPPIMAVADAGIVIPNVSATFLVARAGVNPLAELEASVKRLKQDGGKVSGVLLNGMEVHRGYGYKYGSYKYYQYDYK